MAYNKVSNKTQDKDIKYLSKDRFKTATHPDSV